jgi:hypothetical protein
MVGLAWLRATDGFYVIGQTIPELAGYSVDGTYLEAPRGQCTLLRVTADGCPYCKRDLCQYERVVAEARRRNCFIAVLGPRVGDITMDSGGGVRPLQYVSFDIGRALTPFVTPQTLVVDASRRLVWQRQGALDDDDVVAAARTLQRIR